MQRSSSKKIRRAVGTSISEFPLVLFVLLFLVFLPACNLLLFSSAYLSLRYLTEKTVQSMAMSDSLEKAATRGKELLDNYKNPFLTMLHQVKLVSDTNSCKMSIIIKDRAGKSESYDLKSALPRNKQPDFGDNRNKYLYAYRLQVSCIVYPFVNLSGIPLAGNTPVIGAPTSLELAAQAVIENPDFLSQS